MTRKEFLLHIGVALMVVTGISGIIATITNPDLTRKKVTSGFGSGPYGGVKKG